ncbi:hypothetical protein ABIA27_004542 [Sinorhizobium fredii]
MIVKVNSASRLAGSSSLSGLLECEQHAPANGRRILERLQTRRHVSPFVMAEISMRRTGRKHQRVVGNCPAARQRHGPCRPIDALHLAEQRRHLRSVAVKMADRPGDLGGRKNGGRDLVEQRLKEVVIAPIDERDADRRALEVMDKLQPAEAAAHDHHVMFLLHGCCLVRSN